MSGTPKRPHDDTNHPSSLKYAYEEVGSSYPRLSAGGSSDFGQSFDVGDGRATKLPRTESRDVDRRSPMHSAYRMPTLPYEAPLDAHHAPSESKTDGRDLKDGIDHRGEGRDSRIELKESHSEMKREFVSKSDRDTRFENRADDNKEIKGDKEIFVDGKNDVKSEKDGVSVTSSVMMSWKDSKEFLRGKKYPESQGGHLDNWPAVRAGSRVPIEFRREPTSVEERDNVEVNEAVGENKIDMKSDDRFKDKDRKKKEIRLREWGDTNKERNERRSSLQGAQLSIDGKDLNKEDKEAERENAQLSIEEKKEREKFRDREKDQHKKENFDLSDRENLAQEKKPEDGLPDNSFMEHRKQKEVDSLKNVDKEGKDKRKEKDNHIDNDKLDKKSRLYDKESDDACVDVEGVSERDNETYGYGVQQRKRMYWSRGSPQLGNSYPRFKSRPQDYEGIQGKPEVSSVVYKVGECMQDLVKLWEEHEQSGLDKNGDSAINGPTLEIRIPAEHVTATNRQVRGGQLWGTDIYTNDSDLVAVLMHTGYCRPTAAPPPSAIQELRATIRVLPPQDSYTSMLRNNVRSRAWGAGIGCSYRVERCFIVKKGGGTVELEPCLTHTSSVEPTLAPVAVERTMTTRAAASNALRQQRFVREVTIQYNLCNEPWIKYSISVIADKGLKKSMFTSARLKKGEVLYLETHTCRYELCYNGEKAAAKATLTHEEGEKLGNHQPHASNGDRNDSDGCHMDSFRWARCRRALPQKVMRAIGIPMPPDYVEVIEECVDWEDVQWSQTGVWVAGKEYLLARAHFLSPI